MWKTTPFIHASIRYQWKIILVALILTSKKKKKKIIFRVMRHLSRIFMKEGATRVNFSIPLQLARWQTTLETPLGSFCISNDPVGSIVALMLLRKTFRIIGKKKCSSSGSSHFLANYQSSRTKGETMEEDKSILSKTNSTRNENCRESYILLKSTSVLWYNVSATHRQCSLETRSYTYLLTVENFCNDPPRLK